MRKFCHRFMESGYRKIYLVSFATLYTAYAVLLNPIITSDHIPGYQYFAASGGQTAFPALSVNRILALLASGRPATWFTDVLWWFLSLFRVSIYENRFAAALLIDLVLAWAVCVLTRVVEPYKPENVPVALIAVFCLISYINPYFVEVYTYAGIEYAAGILLSNYAVRFFQQRKYLLTSLFVVLSVGFYQSYVINFLMMAAAVVYLEGRGKSAGEQFRRLGPLGVVCFVPVVINIGGAKLAACLSRILHNAAASSPASSAAVQIVSEAKAVSLQTDILDGVYHRVFGYYWYMAVRGFGYFPDGFLFALLLAMLILPFMILWGKDSHKAAIRYLLFWGFMNLLTVIMYLPIPYPLVARVAWNFFISVSMIALTSYLVLAEHEPVSCSAASGKELTCAARIGMEGIMGLFFLYNVYATQTKAADMVLSNRLDRQIFDSVQAEIEHYEAVSGTKVTTIAPAKSAEAQYQSPYLCLPSVTSAYDHRLMYDEWADVEALNYYENTSYKQVRMTDDQYRSYFGDKSWDCYVPDEQLVFDGDTLYWAIY